MIFFNKLLTYKSNYENPTRQLHGYDLILIKKLLCIQIYQGKVKEYRLELKTGKVKILFFDIRLLGGLIFALLNRRAKIFL